MLVVAVVLRTVGCLPLLVLGIAPSSSMKVSPQGRGFQGRSSSRSYRSEERRVGKECRL